MKPHLMHRDSDFDPAAELPWNTPDLIQDLCLAPLLDAMGAGDPFLRTVAHHAVLTGLPDCDAIGYRQRILSDCVRHPAVIRQLYALALDAIQGEKDIYGGLLTYPEAILHRAVKVLQHLLGTLTRLRRFADDHAARFNSEGLTAFFRLVHRELGDEYLRAVTEHLRHLELRDGTLISARLGAGLKGTGYVLHKPRPRSRWSRRAAEHIASGYTYRVPPDDDEAARALGELQGHGIGLVASTLTGAGGHILDFFRALRTELAFYLGCLNLHARLRGKGEPVCMPEPLPADQPALRFRGLYDAGLSLGLGDTRVVGNSLDAEYRTLLVITGANQGGKSTFLRALGQAQLMTQCGMFVAAERFQASLCAGLSTHFRREEDATMNSGRLEEELARISDIADHLRPASLVLLNESFAATNERDGSHIGHQIIRALLDNGVSVVLVTHLYDLAHSLYRRQVPGAQFLRPQRHADGRRTFTLHPGPPLSTSHGADLYRRIFGTDPEPTTSAN